MSQPFMMKLPAEIIQHIFYFLTPCEIVRLRQVSKQFHDHTQDSSLWRAIYANTDLVLPPGPFPPQPTRYLERTLVQSEVVSKTWTSQPPKVLSRSLTSWTRGKWISWTVVRGRWCIFAEQKTIRCRDIDTNTYHLLYDGAAHPMFRFMAYTASASDIDGWWLCLLLVNMEEQTVTTLLKFRINDDGFSAPESADLECALGVPFNLRRSMRDFHGVAPFIAFGAVDHTQPWTVHDLRACRSYRLPSHMSPISSAASANYVTSQIVLTKTHVIAVQMPMSSGVTPSPPAPVLIQAFVVPASDIPINGGESGELRLTHEAATSHKILWLLTLLRNSTVDPTTGSINIRLHNIGLTYFGNQTKHSVSCLDLTLPKATSTTEVLPISIRSQGLLESEWASMRYTASDDGHARGLLLEPVGRSRSSARRKVVRKFTLDASGDECTMIVSDPSTLEFPGLEKRDNDLIFDGTRGRIHYRQSAKNGNQVITIDLA